MNCPNCHTQHNMQTLQSHPILVEEGSYDQPIKVRTLNELEFVVIICHNCNYLVLTCCVCYN